MEKYKKLICLTACVAMILSFSAFGLTGCRTKNIPTTVPDVSSSPEISSSAPEESSSSAPAESSDVASSKDESSKAASSASSSTGTQTTYSGKTYSKAVTDSKKETLSSVKITATGVILSNKTITGDLIIDKSVGDGKVGLDNVVVGKTIYVYGGGENSIYLNDVDAAKLVSASTVSRPRIVAKGATNISKTEIRYDTLLEYDRLDYNAKGFSTIETVKTTQFLTVLKLMNIGANSLVVNYATNVFLNGSSSVARLIVNAPSSIEGGDKIAILECNSKNVSLDSAPGYITSSKTGDYAPKIADDDKDDDSSTERSFSAPKLSGTSANKNVTWTAVSGAANGYEVRVNLKGSSTYVSQMFAKDATRALDVESLLLSKSAVSGAYEIRVRTLATTSINASAFSNVLTYTYTAPSSTPLTVSNLVFDGSDATKYNLSWVATGATSYNVTVATDSSFKTIKLNKNITETVIDLRSAMGVAFVEGNYYVKVTAKSAFEQISVTAPSPSFTVSKASTPTGFTYNEVTKVLTWGSISGATHYSINITPSGYIGTVGTNSFTLGDITFPVGATYNVSLMTAGWAGNVLDSDVVLYQVNKTSLGTLKTDTVTLQRINNNEFKIDWTAVANHATGYTVKLQSGSTVDLSEDITSVDTITHTFTVLDAVSGNYTATVTPIPESGYSVSPVSAIYSLSSEAALFGSGDGTNANPYKVYTVAQFSNINSAPSKEFIQEIDFVGTVVLPITTFSGIYNGNSKTIPITINGGADSTNVGLFNTITSGATVKNIVVADASTVIGSSNVGMIAGTNEGSITGCTVLDTVNSKVTGTANVGGICGSNTGTITGCTYNGKLFVTGIDVALNAKTDGFGMIAGISVNDCTGNTHNNATITEVGTIDLSLSGMSAPQGIMASRLANWIAV